MSNLPTAPFICTAYLCESAAEDRSASHRTLGAAFRHFRAPVIVSVPCAPEGCESRHECLALAGEVEVQYRNLNSSNAMSKVAPLGSSPALAVAIGCCGFLSSSIEAQRVEAIECQSLWHDSFSFEAGVRVSIDPVLHFCAYREESAQVNRATSHHAARGRLQLVVFGQRASRLCEMDRIFDDSAIAGSSAGEEAHGLLM
jgi:hypothetical protein